LALPTVQLDEIYREVVLDHYKSPRGRKPLENSDTGAEGLNPLCGDEVLIQLLYDGDKIADVSVQGRGCSISVASGSMLAELLPGKTRNEAETILQAFKAMMHGDPLPKDLDVGDLDALTGVQKFPVRIKCALLAWTTLENAMAKSGPSDTPQPKQ
jgi:nitrogen fixation NifU-like protein